MNHDPEAERISAALATHEPWGVRSLDAASRADRANTAAGMPEGMAAVADAASLAEDARAAVRRRVADALEDSRGRPDPSAVAQLPQSETSRLVRTPARGAGPPPALDALYMISAAIGAAAEQVGWRWTPYNRWLALALLLLLIAAIASLVQASQM